MRRARWIVNPAIDIDLVPRFHEGKQGDTKTSHRQGSQAKIAPGLALPPMTVPYGWRGPYMRRGLYTLSPALEQNRAEN